MAKAHLNRAIYVISGTLILLLGYFFWTWKNAHKVYLPLSNCNLHLGPCTAKLPSGESIFLRMTPTNMPVLTSVMLEVKIPRALQIQKMNVHFRGKEMKMGEFDYFFHPRSDGTYTAQTMLPTCSQNEMIWEAVLNIDTESKHYTMPFTFTNQRDIHPQMSS